MTYIIATKNVGPSYVTNKLFMVGDALAQQLIKLDRARLATDKEIKAGRALGKPANLETPSEDPKPKKRGRPKGRGLGKPANLETPSEDPKPKKRGRPKQTSTEPESE